MTFYLEKKDEQLRLGRIAELDEMCLRITRAAALEEAGKNSERSSFMLKTFVTLNRVTLEAMLIELCRSDMAAQLLAQYAYLTPLIDEASTPGWLSNLLGQ